MKTLFLYTGFILFILPSGCKSNNTEKDIVSMSDSASISGFTGDSVKLVKTAGLNFKVKDASQGIRSVSQIAHNFGGLISHQNLESNETQTREFKISGDSILVISSYSPRADITVRVPSEHLEEFMYSVGDLGYFTSNSKLDVDDKSFEYLTFQLQQKNRKALLEFSSNKNIKDSLRLLRLNISDDVIDQNIAARKINADVKYSKVQLSLFQNPLVRKEVIANYAVQEYRLSYSKSFINALQTGWLFFLDFLLLVAHLWMFIFVAIILWFVLRLYKLKRKLLVAR